MTIPRINFYEINEGYSPIRPNVNNRIGILAPFSRGPANQLTFISGYTDFANRYGSDNSVGSIAFQAAWDQRAIEFGLLRILGRAKPSLGDIKFGGYTTKPNTLVLIMSYLGEALQQSDRIITSSIFTSGNFSSTSSGRFWFLVDSIDDEGFIKLKYIFIPQGIETYINWYPEYREPLELTIDPTFPRNGIGSSIINETSEISSISPSLLYLKGAEPIIFTDTCLGLGQVGEQCAQVRQEGWKITIEAGQMRWVWHVDISGTNYRLNQAESGYIGTLPVIIPGIDGSKSFNTAIDSAVLTDTTTGEMVSFEGLQATDPRRGAINPAVIPVYDYVILHQSDKGIPISIANGLFLSFGTMSQQEDISLQPGDMWTVRAAHFEYEIPIYEDASPNQVVTSVIEKIQGVNPIGMVERNDLDNGFIFSLDENNLSGSNGNNFNYHVELTEPDGEVITEGNFFSGEKYIQVPIRYSTYIKEGATVGIIESPGIYGVVNISNPFDPASPTQAPNRSLLPFTTRVTRVEAPITGGGLAIIWLDNPVVSDFDSIAIFHFMNPEGLSITHYTNYQTTFMRGGEDGPRRAERDFYSLDGIPLLKIIATSEGAWGNNLKLSLYPIDNKRIQLTITDLNKDNYDPPIKDEEHIFSFEDTDDRGFITRLNSSNLVRGVFLPKYANPNYNVNMLRKTPMRLAPANNQVVDPEDAAHPENFGPRILKNFTLENGYDGPPVQDEDYIRALDTVRNQPVHILVTPGQWYSNVLKSRLLAQAENANELEGLRIVLLNARPGLTPEAAIHETIGFDSDKGVMVAGWSTYSGKQGAPRFGLSPDVLLAGKLSAIPYHVSPAARTTSGPIFGIAEVDTQPYTSRAQLNLYHNARLEAVHIDPATNSFNFLNGRSLSSNQQWDRISFRRTFNVVRMDIAQNLQQYKSDPNTPAVRSRIASAIDAYLGTLKRNGQISSFNGAEVTSPNPASGLAVIRFGLAPVYAMDYIDVYLLRTDDGNISRPDS